MSRDDERLGAALLDWLNTFDDLEGETLMLSDLSDGVACSEVLHQLIPAQFTASELSNINRDCGGDAAAKVGNLRKLKDALIRFYDLELGVKSRCLEVPDVTAVEEGDLGEMLKLLELLLGAAVQCKDKERRVTELMSLEAGIKADLMSSIQLLMQQIDTAKQSDAAANTSIDMDQLMADKDEVDSLYAKLKEDHEMLTQMYDESQLQLETAAAGGGGGGDGGGGGGGGGGGEANKQMLHRMKTEMEEYKHTLEHERQEHAEENKQQNKVINELQRALDRAEADVGNVERMIDEMEELRVSAARSDALELKCEQYAERMELMSESQQEGADAKKQNTSMMQRIVLLEESERKAISLQQSVAKYKEQISELEATKLEEVKRGDSLLFEVKQAKEASDDLERENKRLHAERRELTAKVRDLEESGGGFGGLGSTLGDVLAGASGSAEDAEKLSRLEAENAMLRAKSDGDSDFQKVMDAESAQKAKLAAENRAISLKLLEMGAELEKVKKKSVKSTDDLAIEQLAVSERSLKQTKAKAVELEAELTTTQEELLALKKEHSLMGLDQKELVAEVERKASEASAEKEAALTKRAEDLAAELDKCKVELAASLAQVADLEPQLAKLKTDRDSNMLELNTALRTNNDLTTRLHASEKETSDKLREQERNFDGKLIEMESRLKSSSGPSNEEMLKLQLEITKLEKEHMASTAKADRETVESEATMKEQIRNKEAEAAKLTVQLQQATAQLVSQKEELGKKAGADLGDALKTLQGEVAKKKRECEKARQDLEKKSAQFAGEQQLMASAWYDLVLQNQRLASRPGNGGSGGNVSFLQRQRMASLQTRKA